MLNYNCVSIAYFIYIEHGVASTNRNCAMINPIPAEVLENQDMQGGVVNFTPPPLNLMFDVEI